MHISFRKCDVIKTLAMPIKLRSDIREECSVNSESCFELIQVNIQANSKKIPLFKMACCFCSTHFPSGCLFTLSNDNNIR